LGWGSGGYDVLGLGKRWVTKCERWGLGDMVEGSGLKLYEMVDIVGVGEKCRTRED